MDNELGKFLLYDPETGHFHWAQGNGRMKAGSRAGTTNRKGYRQIVFRGRALYEHRIAWFLMTGTWPQDQVDHLDGDKQNNALANLRLATNAQNGQNARKPRTTNESGLLGAHKHKNGWAARIGINGKYKHLGLFRTPEEAHEAYLKAKREIHPFGTL